MSDGPPASRGDDGALADREVPGRLTARESVFAGAVFDVSREQVALPGGAVTREVVRHPGAVGVLALDDRGRVAMLRQYRHPVERELWEIPAGLLDHPDEDAAAAAARELGEEADLVADTWHVLADWFTSPGGSDEAFRCYLARDLTPVPAPERFEREDEEADIELRWVALEDARDAALAGKIHNSSAVTAVLAACAARDLGWSTLRPAGAPWPERPRGRQA